MGWVGIAMFDSIEQIKKEFNIKVDQVHGIRKELKRIQASIHPDKNNGEFISDSEKNQYLSINEAIDYIDNYNEKRALMPLREITDLVNVIKELIPSSAEKQESKLVENLETKIKNIKDRHKYWYPKITSTAIFAVLSFIWLFPSALKENPILNKFIDIDGSIIFGIWITSFIITAFVWLVLLREEELERNFLSVLKTETMQDSIFVGFIRTLRHSGNTPLSFTKGDFINYLLDWSPGRFRKIDLEIAENLTEVIFAKAEMKKCIKKYDKKSFTDYYTINESFDFHAYHEISRRFLF